MKIEDAVGKMQIEDAVGKYVRVIKDRGSIQFCAIGKLEASDNGRYYVRISDDPQGHGCNRLEFAAYRVYDVCKQPSGIIEIAVQY